LGYIWTGGEVGVGRIGLRDWRRCRTGEKVRRRAQAMKLDEASCDKVLFGVRADKLKFLQTHYNTLLTS
jgi:hypothetical protein